MIHFLCTIFFNYFSIFFLLYSNSVHDFFPLFFLHFQLTFPLEYFLKLLLFPLLMDDYYFFLAVLPFFIHSLFCIRLLFRRFYFIFFWGTFLALFPSFPPHLSSSLACIIISSFPTLLIHFLTYNSATVRVDLLAPQYRSRRSSSSIRRSSALKRVTALLLLLSPRLADILITSET